MAELFHSIEIIQITKQEEKLFKGNHLLPFGLLDSQPRPQASAAAHCVARQATTQTNLDKASVAGNAARLGGGTISPFIGQVGFHPPTRLVGQCMPKYCHE